MLFTKKEKDKPSKITMMDNKINESYVEEKVANINDKDVETLMDNEETISKRISNATPLRKFAKIGKIMFAMLKDIRNGRYQEVPYFTIASIAVALLYVLNPFDFVPDFIPVIGYVDDLAVMSIALGWIETDLHKYLDWRIKEEQAETH